MTETTAPPRYKLALLTWAAAFPLLTAVNVLLGPILVRLPLPGRTLLMTGLLVGLLTYVIMPRLTRIFATWLSPSTAPAGSRSFALCNRVRTHIRVPTQEAN